MQVERKMRNCGREVEYDNGWHRVTMKRDLQQPLYVQLLLGPIETVIGRDSKELLSRHWYDTLGIWHQNLMEWGHFSGDKDPRTCHYIMLCSTTDKWTKGRIKGARHGTTDNKAWANWKVILLVFQEDPICPISCNQEWNDIANGNACVEEWEEYGIDIRRWQRPPKQNWPFYVYDSNGYQCRPNSTHKGDADCWIMSHEGTI